MSSQNVDIFELILIPPSVIDRNRAAAQQLLRSDFARFSMASDIKAALARQRKAALLACMPCWFDRGDCSLSECGNNVSLTFRCSCKKKKVAQTVYLGQGEKKLTTEKQIAIRIAERVQERHGCHRHTHEAPDPLDAAQEQVHQLTQTLSAQKRKLTLVQNELSTAERKVARAADSQKQVTEHKRQRSRAEVRRKDFDPSSTEKFNKANKSTVMTSDGTGVIDTIKYWCEGSQEKALQLVLAQIRHFELKDRVVDSLGLEVNDTTNYILSQLKSALACLKDQRTEEQRQQYRLALTLVAPGGEDMMQVRQCYKQ